MQSVSQLIIQGAKRRGLDPHAVLAVARVEGLSGAVGDQGTSFGPFQLHRGGALPSSAPRGREQQWAMSQAGIDYALDQIAGVAKGLKGRAAVENIVRRFERPADPTGEVQKAWGLYGGAVPSSPQAYPPMGNMAGPSTLTAPPTGMPDLTSTITDSLGLIAMGKAKPTETMQSMVDVANAPVPAATHTATGMQDLRGHPVNQAAATPLDAGGGWGGSYKPATSLANVGKRYGVIPTSEKRDRQMTASGNTSDHWVGSKSSYAYDLGGTVAQMDKAAKAIAQRLGVKYSGGPLVATKTINGLRYQILYRTNVGGDHFDHIHVGVRKT